MEHKIYYLPIETPNGIIELEISHEVVHKDDESISVTLSATIQGKTSYYQSETTEGALILLAKHLPENWRIKSCLSCRFGHFCPTGNFDNELFCITDFEPKQPHDLWHITEEDNERKNRSRTLFNSCEHYKEQARNYFTYSDYYSKINDMKEDRFDFLTKQFSSYEMKFSEDGNLVEIINPFCNENIKVEYLPDDAFTPYILFFAFQHCHMCDEEDIVDYINNIMNGKVFSIEYFNNGTRCFGGDITAEELKNLSYETLEQKTGYYGITKLKDCVDSFKLRGWHSDYNFDAKFVIDESGSVTIKRLD